MDPSKPANPKPSDLASASVLDTLAMLHVNRDTGLTHAEVDVSRKEHGYNEVAETKGHPVLRFLGKFWGISAWMLELIMMLSAVLRKFSDLAVVSALLFVNAVLSFMQEHRAAGVVETLRKRLQVSARVRRESTWQVIPARELVSVVLVAAFDRIARSTRNFLQIIDELDSMEIEFISRREGVATGDAMGRLFVTIISAIAELERSLVVERVKSGMRRARLEGRQIGRARLDVDREQVVIDRRSGMSLTQVAKKHGISRASVCRLMKEANGVAGVPVPLPASELAQQAGAGQ